MTIDIEKLAKEYHIIADDFLLLPNGENNLRKFAEAYAAKVHDKRVEELEAKNRELSASINDLREALEELFNFCMMKGYIGHQGLGLTRVHRIENALSKTPAQSLQEHDNATIERCANVCDEAGQPHLDEIHTDAQWAAKVLAANIRALKVT